MLSVAFQTLAVSYGRNGMQILVVEDEVRMANLLRRGLEEEGHAVVVASNGKDGLSIALSHPFDVMVLDVMLPGLDGLTVARRLRDRGNRTPILMLTARDAEREVVAGLDVGADDYLTKPFSLDVLLARIRAVSRRGPIQRDAVLRCGDLSLDPGSHTVTRGERPVNLTRTEFVLLEALMRNTGSVVPRDLLIQAVWGFDGDVESNTLDVFVRLLRAKIEAAGEQKVIQTVRGVGYCLKAGPDV
jgi:DNA-binding response OmpR family regulator